jgi:phosphomannomutase
MDVQQWLADDPDPDTRAQLRALIDAGADEEIADCFAGLLQFGTAGLRGRLGPGPNRMNVAVVRRAAAGLAAYLGSGRVAVGYDARHKSALFARETARVLAGAGLAPVLLPEPLPTPVLAFAVRDLDCAAGVMVTASHNPPQDNGYKVYLGDGSQIVPPADTAIAGRIAAVDRVSDLPLSDAYAVLDGTVVDRYVAAAAAVAQPGPRELVVVATSLHGVGGRTLARALLAAGFEAPVPVASQADPDPDFPTVAFPNPEEPGAMDAALAAGEAAGADVIIANDPDADRCAVAVPAAGGFRLLTGDELGALLGWWIIERDRRAGRRTEGVFANSIVSSRLLGRIAAAAGVPHAQTLTGFKWIARTPGLRFGYEEAIGYCVAPWSVADKDGISAAVLVAELVAMLKAQGRGVLDVLDGIAAEHGRYATRQWSVRVADLAVIGAAMQRLREHPPARLAGSPVVSAVDLAAGVDGLPPTDGLRYLTAEGSRVIVRPSGTEPKLKAYLEVVVADRDPAVADRRLARLQADTASAAGLA